MGLWKDHTTISVTQKTKQRLEKLNEEMSDSESSKPIEGGWDTIINDLIDYVIEQESIEL